MAVTLFGKIFATKSERKDKILMNHERIHVAQWKEQWSFMFKYIGSSIAMLFRTLNANKMYIANIFEAEAFLYESNLDYLDIRNKFAYKNEEVIKYRKEIIDRKSKGWGIFSGCLIIFGFVFFFILVPIFIIVLKTN